MSEKKFLRKINKDESTKYSKFPQIFIIMRPLSKHTGVKINLFELIQLFSLWKVRKGLNLD